MPREPLGNTSFLAVSCLIRCSIPKLEHCGCVPRRSRLAAGGDATPSSSLPEKYDQIGPGTCAGVRLNCPGVPLPVPPRATSTGGLWGNTIRQNRVDLGGHRPQCFLIQGILPQRHRRQENQSTLLHIACSAVENKGGHTTALRCPIKTFPCFLPHEQRGYFLKYPTQKSRDRAASATFISDVMIASDSSPFLQKNLLIFCPIWYNIHPDSFIECQFFGLSLQESRYQQGHLIPPSASPWCLANPGDLPQSAHKEAIV